MKKLNIIFLLLSICCFCIISCTCGRFFSHNRPATRMEVSFKPWGQTHYGEYRIYLDDFLIITDSSQYIAKANEEFFNTESKSSCMILSYTDYNELRCLIKNLYCQYNTCDSIVYCEFTFYYQNIPFETLTFNTESQVKYFIEKSKHILGKWDYYFENKLRELDLYKQKKK